ncbi:MAG: hypothetical protein HQL28_06330 [Candidatus Omnitrophica bacterium]|nr:hypothetical protein [Candidatus Omnitrophota bacterium]
MDIEQLWEKAQKKTEVVRGRAKGLSTTSLTAVPYIFLAESAVTDRTTVVRQGKILVEKPLIILPHEMPWFEGFDIEEELGLSQDLLQTFFLMRGIKFPSMKYNNSTSSLDVNERKLSDCIELYKKILEREENVSTALLTGPEDCWQISLLLYIAALAGRCARTDMIKLLTDLRNSGEEL